VQSELVIAVIEALEAESIPYFLAGSFASMVYGIPRATKDVDFVVEIGGDGIDRMARRLAGQFEFDPQQHLETSTWTRRYILRSSSPVFEMEFFHQERGPPSSRTVGAQANAAQSDPGPRCLDANA